MEFQFNHNGQAYTFESTLFHDLSTPIRNGSENVNAYYLEDPKFEPFRAGGFCGDRSHRVALAIVKTLPLTLMATEPIQNVLDTSVMVGKRSMHCLKDFHYHGLGGHSFTRPSRQRRSSIIVKRVACALRL